MKTIDTVYCAAVTPMDSQYNIDFGGLSANIERYIHGGLGGILICGGTGEFVSLNETERKHLVEYAGKTIGGRTGFMVGCAAETTADAIMYARHAQENGADGLLLIASYYFKPSEEELYHHFAAVANAVNIPVVLYNNPGACGSNLSPRLVQRMSKLENVGHLKEAAGDILQFRAIRDACDKEFHMLVGCDALAYELFRNGATGWISITANALVSQSQAIFEHASKGEYEKAWEIYSRYLPIYNACESPYKAIPTIKYVLGKLGSCGGTSRLPRLDLTLQEKEQLDIMLRQTGLI